MTVAAGQRRAPTSPTTKPKADWRIHLAVIWAKVARISQAALFDVVRRHGRAVVQSGDQCLVDVRLDGRRRRSQTAAIVQRFLRSAAGQAGVESAGVEDARAARAWLGAQGRTSPSSELRTRRGCAPRCDRAAGIRWSARSGRASMQSCVTGAMWSNGHGGALDERSARRVTESKGTYVRLGCRRGTATSAALCVAHPTPSELHPSPARGRHRACRSAPPLSRTRLGRCRGPTCRPTHRRPRRTSQRGRRRATSRLVQRGAGGRPRGTRGCCPS